MPSALSPWALGIHIRQITRAHVTTINCRTLLITTHPLNQFYNTIPNGFGYATTVIQTNPSSVVCIPKLDGHKRLMYSQNHSEDISWNCVILSRLEEHRLSFEFTSCPHEEQTSPEAASTSSLEHYQYFTSSICYYKLRLVFGIPQHLIRILAQGKLSSYQF